MRLNDKINNIQELYTLQSRVAVQQDFILSMCGKKINAGQTRRVYEFQLDPKKVLKVEIGNFGNNRKEFEIWEEVKWFQEDMQWVKDWFAPIDWISPSGHLLLMHKTMPLWEYNGKKQVIPDKIPRFFTDVKHPNFGVYKGRYVCHDYPLVIRDFKTKLVKPRWYD